MARLQSQPSYIWLLQSRDCVNDASCSANWAGITLGIEFTAMRRHALCTGLHHFASQSKVSSAERLDLLKNSCGVCAEHYL